MKRVLPFFLLALVAAATAVRTEAQSTTALVSFASQVGNWNAIVRDDASLTNSRVQSGLAVGDTALLSGAEVNQNPFFAGTSALRVYGQLTISGNESRSLNYGATVVRNAGTNSGLQDFSFNGGANRVLTFNANANNQPRLFFNGNSGSPAPAQFLASPDTFFSDRTTTLLNASATLAGLGTTAPAVVNNRLTLSSLSGVAVFNVTSTLLNSLNEIELNAAVGTNLVINVSGGPVTGNFNFIGSSSSSASRVLWNFHDGSDLTINRVWSGSILGPNTSIVANADLVSQLFVEDFTANNSQLRYAQLVAVPEPATYAAILAGLVAAGTLILRRTRVAQP